MTATETEALASVAHCILESARASGTATALLLGGDTQEAQESTRQASRSSQAALGLLRSIGVYTGQEHPARARVPLALLDTPATRTLVAALEAATLAARAVDLERGWVDEEGRPCGIGETLGALYLEWRVEVEGPAGR